MRAAGQPTSPARWAVAYLYHVVRGEGARGVLHRTTHDAGHDGPLGRIRTHGDDTILLRVVQAVTRHSRSPSFITPRHSSTISIMLFPLASRCGYRGTPSVCTNVAMPLSSLSSSERTYRPSTQATPLMRSRCRRGCNSTGESSPNTANSLQVGLPWMQAQSKRG